VPHTREKLHEVVLGEDGRQAVLRLIEDAVNPADYVSREAELQAAVNFLNGYLAIEELELRWNGRKYVVSEGGTLAIGADEALRLVNELDFEACRREFDRARTSLAEDPASAITAASSTLESIAKTMLMRLDEPIPADQSMAPLIRALLNRLSLLPDGQDDEDVRRLLGGLANVAYAVGSLRTKMGSAHGRGDGHVEPDQPLAELCVNAASTAGVYLLKRFSELTMRERQPPPDC
jgi:hypothetical protein